MRALSDKEIKDLDMDLLKRIFDNAQLHLEDIYSNDEID